MGYAGLVIPGVSFYVKGLVVPGFRYTGMSLYIGVRSLYLRISQQILPIEFFLLIY